MLSTSFYFFFTVFFKLLLLLLGFFRLPLIRILLLQLLLMILVLFILLVLLWSCVSCKGKLSCFHRRYVFIRCVFWKYFLMILVTQLKFLHILGWKVLRELRRWLLLLLLLKMLLNWMQNLLISLALHHWIHLHRKKRLISSNSLSLSTYFNLLSLSSYLSNFPVYKQSQERDNIFLLKESVLVCVFAFALLVCKTNPKLVCLKLWFYELSPSPTISQLNSIWFADSEPKWIYSFFPPFRSESNATNLFSMFISLS